MISCGCIIFGSHLKAFPCLVNPSHLFYDGLLLRWSFLSPSICFMSNIFHLVSLALHFYFLFLMFFSVNWIVCPFCNFKKFASLCYYEITFVCYSVFMIFSFHAAYHILSLTFNEPSTLCDFDLCACPWSWPM